MSRNLSTLDKRILNRLQEDIPFVAKPWEVVAKELNINEDFLLDRITFFKKKGIIRRISAVFSPNKINFVSTLVAVKTAPGNVKRVAKEINFYPEVTHNYSRNGEYSIWFTLIASKKKRLAHIISELKKNKYIEKISEFPTVKSFKINVKFSS